jgi:hypothetical protein
MTHNSDEEALRAMARLYDVEYVPPRLIDTRRALAGLIPESIARAFHVLAQPSNRPALKVLFSDPLNFEAIDAVRFSCGRQIEMALATERAIQESIDRVYETFDSEWPAISEASPLRHRTTIVVACLFLGVLPLLQLNGQAFTNALIALPFFLAATALCSATALSGRTPEHRKRAWRFATMLTGLVAIVIILGLPSARRFQAGFNKSIIRARQISAEAIKRGQ